MKVWHWVIIILAIMGAIFLYHNWRSHGGVPGVKQGLGFGGNAG